MACEADATIIPTAAEDSVLPPPESSTKLERDHRQAVPLSAQNPDPAYDAPVLG